MSAYMVSKTHIDAMITAGLSYGRYGPMSCYDRHIWSWVGAK